MTCQDSTQTQARVRHTVTPSFLWVVARYLVWQAKLLQKKLRGGENATGLLPLYSGTSAKTEALINDWFHGRFPLVKPDMGSTTSDMDMHLASRRFLLLEDLCASCQPLCAPEVSNTKHRSCHLAGGRDTTGYADATTVSKTGTHTTFCVTSQDWRASSCRLPQEREFVWYVALYVMQKMLDISEVDSTIRL